MRLLKYSRYTVKSSRFDKKQTSQHQHTQHSIHTFTLDCTVYVRTTLFFLNKILVNLCSRLFQTIAPPRFVAVCVCLSLDPVPGTQAYLLRPFPSSEANLRQHKFRLTWQSLLSAANTTKYNQNIDYWRDFSSSLDFHFFIFDTFCIYPHLPTLSPKSSWLGKFSWMFNSLCFSRVLKLVFT